MCDFSLQFVSDIHLEFRGKSYPIIEPKAKYLALLGDIGYPRMDNYHKFIEMQIPKFKRIFIIAGNHEYYSHKYIDTLKYMIEYFNTLPNVTFLNNSSFITDENIKIVGSTLWSHIPISETGFIIENMNDYHKIKKERAKITPVDTNQWHKESVEFISKELQTDMPTIVLSHHVPYNSLDFIPEQFHTSKCLSAYYSDLSYLFKPPLKYWLFGHCHVPITYKYDQVILMSNPLGYPSENYLKHSSNPTPSNSKYDACKIIIT